MMRIISACLLVSCLLLTAAALPATAEHGHNKSTDRRNVEALNLSSALQRIDGLVIHPGKPTGIISEVLLPMRPGRALSMAPSANAAVCMGGGAEALLRQLARAASETGLKIRWIPLSRHAKWLLPFDRELQVSAPDSAIYVFAVDGRGIDARIRARRWPVPQTTWLTRRTAEVRARRITIALAGDVMFSGVTAERHQLGMEVSGFDGVCTLMQSADVALVNLETPISTEWSPTPLKTHRELLLGREFIFRAEPEQALNTLNSMGVDAVTLANNHALDHGVSGLDDTRRFLKEGGIFSSGAGTAKAAYAPVIIERKGLRLALLSYVEATTLPRAAKFEATNAQAGVAMVWTQHGMPTRRTQEMLAKNIAAAREAADIVIVGMHWGQEVTTQVTPAQRTLARLCVDLGADMVWGHHPHCLQRTEVYRGRLIAYSMGNFIFNTPLRPCLLRTGVLMTCFDTRGLVAASVVPAIIGGTSYSGHATPHGFPAIVNANAPATRKIREDLQ